MSSIRVTKFEQGKFLRVQAPKSEWFATAAKSLQGSWRNGAWVFYAAKETLVRRELVNIFGHDGQLTGSSDVCLKFRPGIQSDDKCLEIAGVTIVVADDEAFALHRGKSVQIVAGEFLFLPQGAHLNSRTAVGPLGATVVIKNLPTSKVKVLCETSHPWLVSCKVI